MKRILAIMLLLFCLTTQAFSEVLKAGVVEVKMPKGFFGMWRVTSDMVESNNPRIFNKTSVDVWVLNGFGNTLILENPLNGASSEITIKDTNINGMTLKFTRTKTKKQGMVTYKNIEIPVITLNGNKFGGYDTYILEKWENGVLLEKNVVKYKVTGEKISGD